MKKFFALLLALVMSLSLVACGGGDTANEDTSTDDTATEENGGDTATASDVEIAVVLKTLASEYWGYVKAGCDAAAADLGVTVNVVGPGAESEIEQQVSMIEQQIGAGCDAIIVAPNDAGAASGALASAIGSIPVLSVDTNVGIEGQTSFVGTSNVDAAKEGGLWAAEQAGEGANAVIIYGQEGDNTSNMRREGYQAACDEAGVLHDVSFKAYGGQITGFAGLVGAGRTETMRAIFGADRLDSGEIYVKGEKVHIRTPKDAIKKKIAFLTEDRKGQGLVLSLDVRTNLILANMKGFSNGPFLNKGKIEKSGQDNVESLRIKTPSLDEVTAQLSGGNQQEVVIGKWVNTDADIFIFDEPTRGIDVGAKIEVYHVMNDLVKAGKCVIMVSSELPEILAMSDHVVVMRGGRVMANIDRDTPHFNSEDIMKAAWGGELD